MIENLLNSKISSQLLTFFIFGSQRSFSAREVSRVLRLPYLKTVRSLNNLSRLGPIRSFVKKSKKYYIVNRRYQLPLHVRGMLLRRHLRPKTDRFFINIKKLGKIKAAFLSGIFAGYSDLPVDILLVGKINLRKLATFLQRTEQLMGQEINYSIMTPNEFLARRDTFDKFIRDIFDYRHVVVCDILKKKK